MEKDFSDLVRNGQTTLSNDEGDSPKLAAVLASCGNSPEVAGVRLEAAIDAYEKAEAKKAEAEARAAEAKAKVEAEAKVKAEAEAEAKAKAEAEAKAAEEKAKAESKRIRILLEDHFDNLVKELQGASSLLARLGKEDPSDYAVLSDSVRHLNDASSNLFFVRRDTDKFFENIEDLVNEAFRQATEQLIAMRENRPADSLRCIVTLVNVALRLSTECLVDVRTEKD